MTGGIGEGPRTVVLLSGSGTNLQAIIDRVEDGGLAVHLAAVVSDQPDAAGLARARRHGIPNIAVDYASRESRAAAEADLGQALARFSPELIVLAGFMRILPDDIVTAHAGRMLNIHPSLLPRYRGLNTYERVLAAGDDWHGSSVHFVIPELDAGPVIIQYRVRVRAEDTPESLAARVKAGEYLIYPRAIGWLAAGRVCLAGGRAELDGRLIDGPVIVEEPSRE